VGVVRHRANPPNHHLAAIDEHASLRASSPSRVQPSQRDVQHQGGYDPASPMRNAAARMSGQQMVGDAGRDRSDGPTGRDIRERRPVNGSNDPNRNSNYNYNCNYSSGTYQQTGARQHTIEVPKNWSCGDLLGQGAFGSVYLGMDSDSGTLMAVKQVSLGHSGSSSTKLAEHIKSLEAEVNLLKQLDHPNIVRYLGTEKTPKVLNIFLEYVPGGSIASLLANFGSFKEPVVKLYTKQILLGLAYLHRNAIMHRDIKGANILVDNTGTVKLADFGASKKIEELVTVGSGANSVKGTPYWMAPEVITQTGHGRQADIWSVACTVIEMATGKPPWSQYGSQVSAMFHIAKSKGPPLIPHELSPECKDFLYLCFNRNWRERPSAETLLEHPFVADVKCPTVCVQPRLVMSGDAGTGVSVPDAKHQQPRARRQLQLGEEKDRERKEGGQMEGDRREDQRGTQPQVLATKERKVAMRASAPVFSAVIAQEAVAQRPSRDQALNDKMGAVAAAATGAAPAAQPAAPAPLPAARNSQPISSNTNSASSARQTSSKTSATDTTSVSNNTHNSNHSSAQFNPVEEPEGIHQQAKHAIDSLKASMAMGTISIGAATTASLASASSLGSGGVRTASGAASGATTGSAATATTATTSATANTARTVSTTRSNGPIVYTIAGENSNDSSVPGLPWDVRESWASGGTGATGTSHGTVSSAGTNPSGATHTTGSTVVNAGFDSSCDRGFDKGLDRSWSSTSSHSREDSLDRIQLTRPKSARDFSTPRKSAHTNPRSAASTPGHTPSRIPRPPVTAGRHSTPMARKTPSKQGLAGRHSMPTPGRQYVERLERKKSGGMAPPPPRSVRKL
jgi:serine/threonine protein kinase